tara:strand:- start:45 stop:515 length:471 start_codon:yes stop_codon:yes gene_type:complete
MHFVPRLVGSILLAGFFAMGGETQNSYSNHEQFSKVVNCLVKTNFTKDLFNQMLDTVANSSELRAKFNIDHLSTLVVALDDGTDRLATMVADIAAKNDWTGDRLEFRLNSVTAGLYGELNDRISLIEASGDPLQLQELMDEMLMESVACHAELQSN